MQPDQEQDSAAVRCARGQSVCAALRFRLGRCASVRPPVGLSRLRMCCQPVTPHWRALGPPPCAGFQAVPATAPPCAPCCKKGLSEGQWGCVFAHCPGGRRGKCPQGESGLRKAWFRRKELQDEKVGLQTVRQRHLRKSSGPVIC